MGPDSSFLIIDLSLVVGGGGWWWGVVGMVVVIAVGDDYRRAACQGWQRETTEGPWRPRKTIKASSLAQIWAQDPESSPLPRPPGPLKVRVFEKLSSVYMCIYVYMYICKNIN